MLKGVLRNKSQKGCHNSNKRAADKRKGLLSPSDVLLKGEATRRPGVSSYFLMAEEEEAAHM